MVLGTPPFYPQKGQESPRKPKGYQKALKATKRLQKAPPFFPQKGSGKPQKALKGYQKALKATKRLQEASQIWQNDPIIFWILGRAEVRCSEA